MTSYVRGDRFNEGLFLNVVLSGKIGAILRRLEEIKETLVKIYNRCSALMIWLCTVSPGRLAYIQK